MIYMYVSFQKKYKACRWLLSLVGERALLVIVGGKLSQEHETREESRSSLRWDTGNGQDSWRDL